MVRVCDAIMGTGKSMSAINYMNEHADQRFIYITPYLEEAARIKDNCPDLHFIEPSNRLEEYGFKKNIHIMALIERGANISSTHQAFKGYTPDMLEMIKAQNYTLIIDENVDILEKVEVHPDDIKLALEAGYIQEENGIFTLADVEYHGKALKELFYMMKSRELIRITDKKNNGFFYWALPPDLITAFREVFILTYLFEGQSLHHLLEIYHIPYEYIGIEKGVDGKFRFGKYPGYIPEYAYHMKDRIHILDNRKLNEIGDDYYALSMNWFQSGRGDVGKLKNNIDNCFRHIWEFIPADYRMCGTFNDEFYKIKGKGYSKSFVTFNQKATNAYRHKIALVYASNVFMNAAEKQFYTKHGIKVDEKTFALSVAAQWIWRSAIRDGNEVWIYIPSRRMRNIIKAWINSFTRPAETAISEGGVAVA